MLARKSAVHEPGQTPSPAHIHRQPRKWQVGSELESKNGTLSACGRTGGCSDYSHGEVDATGEAGSDFDNEEWEGRAELLHRAVGPFTGAFGIQARKRDMEAAGEGGELLAPTTTEAIAAFLFEEMPLAGERLKLQLGGRIEQVEVSGRALDASIPRAPPDHAVDRRLVPIHL